MTRSGVTEVQCDVVVIGAGMSGLVASVSASMCEADVVVLEKARRAGGSMYLSAGALWTLDSYEEARRAIPHGNANLQRLVVESLADDVAWLVGLGIEVAEGRLDLSGQEHSIEPAEFTRHMTDLIEANGGEVRYETSFSELVTDDDGSIAGVRAIRRDGELVHVSASSVILATGGFQGNEELVERFITDHPENLRLRSNPWSTGDGLLAALAVGAKSTVGLGNFYGHNVLAPPAEFSPLEFRDATQYYGNVAIALDVDGRRFTDESKSDREEILAQDTAKVAGGRAFLVVDAELREEPLREGKTVGTVIDQAFEYGGRVARCETLETLGSTLRDWGVDGDRAVREITAFNGAIRRGSADRLDPKRSRERRTIDTPPFYVMAVQPGITFTMGGLSVDDDMRVLRRYSSSSLLDEGYVPEGPESLFFSSFDSLFAAGVDVGNVSHRHYMGGLSQALVTGRIAGRNAAEQALHDEP